MSPIVLVPTVVLCLIATQARAQMPHACVDLDRSWQTARAFGALLLKHGQAHYRLHFSQGCGDLGSSQILEISAGQRPNRLCPSGNRIRTARSSCEVTRVEPIDEAAFKRYRRYR